MAAIANTELSQTFKSWRLNTNQTSTRLNAFATNKAALYANTITANVALIAQAGANCNLLGTGNLLITKRTKAYANVDMIGLTTTAQDVKGSINELKTGLTAVNVFISANTQTGNSVIDAHAIAPGAIVAGKIAVGGVSSNTQFASFVVDPHALAPQSVVAGKIATAGVSANSQLASGVVDPHALG